MIDTQGGGIKKMFAAQVKRFFPLPDYDLSNPDRVAVTLRGEIIDERYTRLLIARTDLDLWDAILLDKLQKKIPIFKDQYRRLRSIGAIEGRYPNIFISAHVAKAIGESAQHIKNRGLGSQYDMDQIYDLVQKHGPVTRRVIDELLLERLPAVLSEDQKKRRIHYYLSVLAREGKIVNKGSRRAPQWVCSDNKTE
jgi:ATP-dependent DNA helicase RecG